MPFYISNLRHTDIFSHHPFQGLLYIENFYFLQKDINRYAEYGKAKIPII
jgi:hypothetical protein